MFRTTLSDANYKVSPTQAHDHLRLRQLHGSITWASLRLCTAKLCERNIYNSIEWCKPLSPSNNKLRGSGVVANFVETFRTSFCDAKHLVPKKVSPRPLASKPISSLFVFGQSPLCYAELDKNNIDSNIEWSNVKRAAKNAWPRAERQFPYLIRDL